MEALNYINNSEFNNLELFAKQVVEGFVTGIHKSPFHGFSVEFSEHKLYNQGESIKYIDWKLFAKTKKLFVKRFEEETNLRCHIVIDNSSSMYFPKHQGDELRQLSKISFSVIASACLIEILKRQRDAVGLCLYSDKIDYLTPSKGSGRHRAMLMHKLDETLNHKTMGTETDTHTVLHQISEKIHRRSLVFLFTDMFQSKTGYDRLLDALRHLKYNKHEVVLFHTYDKKTEVDFDYSNTPKRYVDVETNQVLKVYPEQIKENYNSAVQDYFDQLKLRCLQYQIDYVPVDIRENFEKVLGAYLIARRRFY